MPRFTKEQKRLIRDFGKRLAGTGRTTLDLGIWYFNGDAEKYPHFKNWSDYNFLSPPAPPEEDTDLSDMMPWSSAVKEVFPNDAMLDFYVYSLGYDGQLEDNLIVQLQGGKIVRLYRTGTMDRDIIWEGEV